MADLVESPQTVFSDEVLEDENYRRFSVWALISLVAGFASLLAVFHPLFWLLPVVAIGVSLVAAAWIKRRESQLTGHRLVVLSLLVSCFVLTYGPVRMLTRELRLQRLAKTHADAWFTLVREGRLREAHQLHMDPDRRESGGKTLDEVYQPPAALSRAKSGDKPDQPSMQEMQSMMTAMNSPAADFERFYEGAAVAPLKSRPQEVEIEFTRFDRVRRKSVTAESVDLHYVFTYPEAGGRKVVPVLVRMTRYEYGDASEAKWAVEDLIAETDSAS